jgi:uncharacterized C2H2 Zn-finger protein
MDEENQPNQLNNKPTPPVLLKCPRCGYMWYSKSKGRYVVCPHCHTTFKKEGAILER